MQNSERFNCLSEQMCEELIDAVQFGYDSECVGIVIKAQTQRGVWSAGHDIKELPQDGTDPLAFPVPMEILQSRPRNVFTRHSDNGKRRVERRLDKSRHRTRKLG